MRPYSSGVVYPTVSGRFITVAPASITCSMMSAMKSQSERVTSSADHSTSVNFSRAYLTISTDCFITSSGVIFSLYSIWIGDVARKMWIRGFGVFFSASHARSISSFLVRARAVTDTSFIVSAISFTAWKSPSEAAGKPASMTSTPSFSSCFAISSFSILFRLTPGDCSPSRSVVSKILIRDMNIPFFLFVTDRLFDKWHQFAQVLTYFCDWMLIFLIVDCIILRTSRLVFKNPAFGEFAALDFRKHLFHARFCFVIDYTRSGNEIPPLRCIRDGVAHVFHAAFIHEVHDELHLMETFEISDFRLVTCICKCFKPGFDKACESAAEYR